MTVTIITAEAAPVRATPSEKNRNGQNDNGSTARTAAVGTRTMVTTAAKAAMILNLNGSNCDSHDRNGQSGSGFNLNGTKTATAGIETAKNWNSENLNGQNRSSQQHCNDLKPDTLTVETLTVTFTTTVTDPASPNGQHNGDQDLSTLPMSIIPACTSPQRRSELFCKLYK